MTPLSTLTSSRWINLIAFSLILAGVLIMVWFFSGVHLDLGFVKI